MANTPNMNLDLPVVTETPGPEWANQLNEALNVVDGHNHTPGFGAQVPTAGLNINADVDFNGNAASDVKSIALTSQNANDQTYLRNIYSKLGDLWYNNEANQAVQITDGGSIAGGGGGGGTPVVVQGEIFVSKNGNDSTGTGSATAPFLTIGQALIHAASMYAATDYIRINVGPGVYAENVTITRQRTVILGANTAPEELTTVISGYVSIDCPTAASKFQDVIGLTGIQINCTSANASLQIIGTGLFLVSVNECYITTGTTDQSAVLCTASNAGRPAVYFKNSIITRYANLSIGTVMLLTRGDVRIDNVRLYASVTGTSIGIDISNNATLFANNLLLEKSTSNAGISVYSSVANIPLVLSNSSITVSYIGASAVSAISLAVSGGASAFIYNSLLTVNGTGANQYAIAGAPPIGVAFYYSQISFGGLNTTVSPVISAAAVQLSRLGITPVVNGGTGLSAPGPAGNVLTSTGAGWTTSTPVVPPALTNWTEAQAAYGGRTIDSFTAVAAGADADGVISPKGNGALLGDIPDGAATGGDVRGIYATDWQRTRSVSNRVAAGDYSTISGGADNRANAYGAVVAGGQGNIIAGASPSQYAVIAGGSGNTASGVASALVGGASNGVAGDYGFVGSGQNNSAAGQYGTVVAGNNNNAGTVATTHGFIGNGSSNIVSASYGSIVGGDSNVNRSTYGSIGGGQSNVLANATSHGTVAGGRSNYAGQYAVVAGGYGNTAATSYSAIVGGTGNAGGYGSYNFVGGGEANTELPPIFAGYESSYYVIGGGQENQVKGSSHGFIGGGNGNDIIGRKASCAGGFYNKAHGQHSAIPGGSGADTRGVDGRFAFASGNPEPDYDNRRGVTQMTINVPFKDTTDASTVQLTMNGLAPSGPSLGTYNWTNVLVFASSEAQLHYGAMKVRVEVIARNRNTAVTDVKGWTIEGIATRSGDAATTAVTGVTSTTFGAGLVGATATLVADTTTGGIAVEVAGLVGTNIRWAATVYVTEIKIY